MVGNNIVCEMEKITMNHGVEKRAPLLPVIIISAMVVVCFFPLDVQAADPTVVWVNPAATTVSAGQTFSINVSCLPGQAIKSYELKVSYNVSLLQVNSVSEGSIFSGYDTFFNDGTINNTAGTIVDIYGLILGAGSVSSSGSLITLSFTAALSSGTSSVALYDVGVTNDSAYIPLSVINGSVILRQFTLDVALDGSGSVAKAPNQATYSYGTVVQLTATADSGWAFSSWTGDVSGSSNPASITITGNKSVTAYFSQNQYTLTVTMDGSGSVTKSPNAASYASGTVVMLTATASSGWVFSQWTGDLSGSQNPKTITMNSNKTVVAHFSDSMLPQISGVSRTTSDPEDTDPLYGWVNVSCTVTDNVAVSQVSLKIHTPGGSWNNVSMTTKGSGVYYYRSTTAFCTSGNYTYVIWANDSASNTNTSSSVLFSMPENWDINNDGYCTIFDLVLISNTYSSSGSNGWIREDADNNGDIEVLDLVTVANHYGESWW